MSEPFFQDSPVLGNPWRADAVLGAALARRLPAAVLDRHAPALDALGAAAAGEMLALAREAERDPPRHVPFDAWGRRLDRIEVSPAWARLHALAAEHGVVATAYERAEGEHARLLQAARLYLYHPSSAVASCPLAMTDGAARVLERHGSAGQRARILPRLLARDPDQMWTSGQWMTERRGGSDVSGTETVARPIDGERFALTGLKWFSSATTAQVALALARIEGAPAGSRGLTLFLVELEGQVGRAIRVLRLKDKLGTRALPTAELELDGALATRVGEPGRGVATVATMLNVTRLYNATCAAGALARALQLARDYATRRVAFGRLLRDHPAHAETLATLAAEQAGALHLVLECAALDGREAAAVATAAERARLRLLTPVAKLLTARQAVTGVSEALEALGGAGYLEESGLPALWRDTQVLSIWEGTTDVLALDALRAIEREEALEPLLADLAERHARLAAGPLDALAPPLERRRAALAGAAREVEPARREAGARAFALALGRLVEATLLAEQAAWDPERGAAEALARRFVARGLGDLGEPVPLDDTRRLVAG